jgi:hypothetical protein
VRLLASGESVKSGPIGFAVILVLCIACYFLFKSMSKHLRKVREEFPGEERPAEPGADEPGADRPVHPADARAADANPAEARPSDEPGARGAG